ncbi:hypothetical protein P5673_001964 [Acropora cervicornis]|uniref:Uncharacterized protein n=1 Tax=Acropora cervicornis TaxID=6130 RepID=A0AAD9R4Y9_ACRCE|nr:hypothetical protein P5673_001964 [Acropora cervicornis]
MFPELFQRSSEALRWKSPVDEVVNLHHFVEGSSGTSRRQVRDCATKPVIFEHMGIDRSHKEGQTPDPRRETR